MRATVDLDGDVLVIRIPMKLRRRGGRTRITVPEGIRQFDDSDGADASPLLLAVARAHLYQEMLDTGEVASIQELAARLRVERSYIGRILKLACLSPRVVEEILRGDEPEGKTVDQVAKSVPLVWEQ